MKKLGVILVSLLIVSRLTTYANDYTTPYTDSLNAPEIKLVTSPEGKKVKLIYQGQQKENVRIRIYDEERNQLYYDFFKKTDQLLIPFDFKQVPDGSYSFELVGESWKFSDKVDLGDKSNNLKASLDLIASSKIVRLTVENPGTSSVYVIIRDTNDHVLLDDLVELDSNGIRNFNLAEVNTDVVTFVILTENKSYKQQLRF